MQGEMNRRMILLLHVQVNHDGGKRHHDQSLTLTVMYFGHNPLTQERVYPVALTEGATLLPSLLLLLIFLILSCVLLTILIIRGR